MTKQISLGLALLGLTASAAYAGHAGQVMLPAAPPAVSVTIPQQMGSWQVGLEALYQKQANGDFHYALSTDSVTVGTTTTAANSTHTTDAEYAWGGHIDLSYLFEGNGRDVRVGYTHHDDTESDSKLLSNLVTGTSLNAIHFEGSTIVTPNAIFTEGWEQARGKSENDYDAIDVTFGQKMDFGTKVTLHAFAGVRWAAIENDDTANYSASNDASNITDAARLKLNSDFQGIGPRAGMDGMVRLGGGFSAVGTVGASLLVGDFDQSFKFDQVENASGTVTADTTVFKISDQTRVVPEMDMRLGLNYTRDYSSATVGLELGYEVVNYFDVKDNSLVSYVDTAGSDSDFGMHGPYLRVQIDMA